MRHNNSNSNNNNDSVCYRIKYFFIKICPQDAVECRLFVFPLETAVYLVFFKKIKKKNFQFAILENKRMTTTTSFFMSSAEILTFDLLFQPHSPSSPFKL